jgi:PIN domain nuclease of toxin-antitoxin system
MRLLLDTHAFLWATGKPALLSPAARDAVSDRANDVYVSAAVAWEIAIKAGRGKLRLPMGPATFVPSRIAALGFTSLPISLDHALAVAALPATHADPFDRILIAQAQFEGLTLVTRDATMLSYPVQTLEA